MEPIFLTNLSPASVDPEEIVNRENDAQWLRDGLTAWLGAKDPAPGGAFCILGEKGIGKSILTRRVIEQLRQVHTGTTLFITVDCRPLREQRDVYREAASQIVEELRSRQAVPRPLVDVAHSFDVLTRFDEVTLKHAHEHLLQYRAGVDLGGTGSLFKWLDAKLGISMSRSKKIADTLEGSITVDAPRLHEAFVQLLADILHHARLRVVLYLDNIEELNHEAFRDDVRREAVRADVEALMQLSEAPLGLVLNMRTYYSSVLTRRISKRRALGRLPSDMHSDIFKLRIRREHQDKQASVSTPVVQTAISQLATLARTPLAFLAWAEFVLEEGCYGESDMAKALLGRLDTHYSMVARFIPRVVALFEEADAIVDREKVQEACDQSDSVFRQLLDHQILLPNNYWDPREFQLDPELGFLVGRADLFAG